MLRHPHPKATMRYQYRSLKCQAGHQQHDHCPGHIWKDRTVTTGPGFWDCDCPCHIWQHADSLMHDH